MKLAWCSLFVSGFLILTNLIQIVDGAAKFLDWITVLVNAVIFVIAIVVIRKGK